MYVGGGGDEGMEGLSKKKKGCMGLQNSVVMLGSGGRHKGTKW